MRGRPITNHSPLAQYKREHMRRARAAAKVRPSQFNPHPLAQVIAQHWRTS